MPATKDRPTAHGASLKALVETQSFRDAFAEAAAAVPSRSPKPILMNVRFDIDPESGSYLLATDLERSLKLRVLGVKAEAAGAVILPTAKIRQILATTTDDELAIEVEGDHLHVRGVRTRYKLSSEDPSLFPSVPDFTATDYLIVGAADLRRAILRTIFATDVESTRYALGGCLFEPTVDSLSLVGTDGRRLARQTMTAEREGTKADVGQPVLPTKSLKGLLRLLSDEDPPVHIAFDKSNAAIFRTERAVVWTRLVEGRFPRYQDVFPAEFKSLVALEVEGFLRAIEQASITTSEESRGVDFTFSKDLLKLESQAADAGSSQIEYPVEWSAPPLNLTIDARYLVESLKALAPETIVQAEIVDGKNAVVFKTEDRYTYVIMPLTRDR